MILEKTNSYKTVINIEELNPNIMKFLRSLLKRHGKPAPFCDGFAFCYDCIVGFRVINELKFGITASIKDNKNNIIDERLIPLIEFKNNGVVLNHNGIMVAKKIQYYHF